MGRYAQGRRRGGILVGGSGLTSPPAPILQLIAGHVTQRHTGADDPGGQCQLWSSDDGGLSFAIWDIQPWIHEKDWGPVGNFPGLILRSLEVGNGTVYVGSSPWSNVIGPL